MFWITGGDALARALAASLGWPWPDRQMEHVPWAGTLYRNGTFLRI
jgi:hypothetical protein